MRETARKSRAAAKVDDFVAVHTNSFINRLITQQLRKKIMNEWRSRVITNFTRNN